MKFTSDDIQKACYLEAQVIKIQAHFRRRLTLNKLGRRVETLRATIKMEGDSNPELLALTEYVTQLRAKKLTPEAFFRLCDKTYKKSVEQKDF